MVHDIAPGAASSAPRLLGAQGSVLYFSADDGITGRELWRLDAGARGCSPSAHAVCLSGGRFRAEIVWRDFDDNTGPAGGDHLSKDTGAFWFFEPGNVDAVVKVLDGGGINGHHWVFNGALSNVEYRLTVTDAVNGTATRYLNPLGVFASFGDTEAFGPRGARLGGEVETYSTRPIVLAGTARDRGACLADSRTLCLDKQRFAVDVSWRDFGGNTGVGYGTALSEDTGTFWFFDDSNVEVIVKVLDGRAINGSFWVFYGALSNTEYSITVRDTTTGAQKTYINPLGSFGSLGDITALPEP
jgi:hypothetical protein